MSRLWTRSFHRRFIGFISAGILMPYSLVAEFANSMETNEISLEELTNIKVISVCKKETRLENSPAAIAVITQDDIQRLGIDNIPEALRLIPGMDVARIDNHTWAVSARGFQGQFANKLLVMVDGRTVYESAFAGVNWETVNPSLEDLDRIEIVRGPGATLWGANAVNGVVNIITKDAKDTQGILASQSLDNELRTSTTIRYGGQAATDLFYRVYAKYFNRDGFETSQGTDAPDDWNMTRAGLHLDWEPSSANHLTLQGDCYYDEAGQANTQPLLAPPYSTNFDVVKFNNGGNLLGRWTRTFSEKSELSLQAFWAHEQFHIGVDQIKSDTFDVEFQHRFNVGNRHDFVWGAGYRLIKDDLEYIWFPPCENNQLFTAFVQDDATVLADRLHFIFGSKFEHNDQTGFEIQPGARLLWTPTENQTVWASVSRAVRTPDRFERGGQIAVSAFPTGGFPPVAEVVLRGNPDVSSEKLIAYEIGYRAEPRKNWSFDVAIFYNDYDQLIDFVPAAVEFVATPTPHLLLPQTAANVPGGDSFGAELSTQWQVREGWRLQAGYSWLDMNFTVKSTEYGSPQQQARLTSYLDLPGNLKFSGTLAYVDRISNLNVPAYFRLDLGLVWRAAKELEIGIFGQNLIDDRHFEFPNVMTTTHTEIPRSVVGKIIVRF